MDGRAGSWVQGTRATFVLPLRRPQPIDATLLLRPAWPGTRLTIKLRGRKVLDRQLRTGWNNYPLHLRASRLTARRGARPRARFDRVPTTPRTGTRWSRT